MTDGIDLTGRWEGVYFYPIHEEMNPFDDLPATPFTANVTDHAGLIEGRSLEPDLFGDLDAPPIPARWEGHHADGELTFTKFPDGGGQIHTIDYFGSISGDANSVSGRWVIYGEWEGTFRMQRRVVAADVAAEATAQV
jgi:hypothetical protein